MYHFQPQNPAISHCRDKTAPALDRCVPALEAGRPIAADAGAAESFCR